MITLIAFLLGLVHVLSPDHWVPLSLQSWQRGWNYHRTQGLVFQLMLLHVAMGLLAALILGEWARGLGPSGLFAFSLGLVLVMSLARFVRFSRLREAFLAGPQSKRGLVAAWGLLGPAESLVPVVMKSVQLGEHWLAPVIAYTAGTLIAGSALVFWGRRLWNQPSILARGYLWVGRLSLR